MQQDFERRGDRGRGEPDRGSYSQRDDDRDYERIYDNYGESSGEFDPRRRREQYTSGSDRDRSSEQRQDRYTDEMRGFPGDQDRFQQDRFRQDRGRGPGSRQGFEGGSQGWDDQNRRQTTDRGYGQRGTGRPSSPYDQGEISTWYGGDSGMGDSGSSLDTREWDRDQRGRQRSGWDERSQRQSSSQYGPPSVGRRGFDQDQYRGRTDSDRFGGSSSTGQSGRHAGSEHSIEGPFTGRGPRGYHRSDERIYEDVCDLLTRHGEIDASQMEVEVHNGVLELHGTADSGRIRRLTEEVVEEVPGVRDVRNDLRVNQRTGYAETTSPDMQRSNGGRSDTGRFDADRSQLAHHDWERSDAGRHDTGASEGTTQTLGQGERTESGAFPMRSGSTATSQTQAGGRFSIRESMDVVGSDGVIVGRVKEARSNDFLVGRSMQRDLYVPFSAIQTVDGDRVMLNVLARDLDQQGWQTPDLAETSQQRTSGS